MPQELPQKFKQQRAIPTQKVAAGTLSGSASILVIYILNTYIIHDQTKQIPDYMTPIIAVVISAIISYIVPPSARDQIEPD